MSPENILLEEAHGHYEAKRFEQALACLETLGRLYALPPQLLRYKAQCLYHLRRAPEAANLIRTLLLAEPTNADYKIALAQFLRALGEHEESLALLSEVPADMPGRSWLTGWHTMRQGNFLDGFRVYEKEMGIYRASQLYPLSVHKKLTKETSLQGATLLLVLEGGNGDEVAFVRFAQLFAAQGARVLVLSSSGMAPLLKTARGVVGVVSPTELKSTTYDYWIEAMSSVDLLGVNDPSSDIVFPYIFPNTTLVEQTRSEFSLKSKRRPYIGMQWQGNPEFDYVEFKSVPVGLLQPFGVLGTLFSFQREARAHGLAVDIPMVDTEAHNPTWEETAAALSQMDYVISADTTVAHMAGALGKRTLLMVPHAPHAYWAAATETTKWYPTIRVFRQPSYNDWRSAIHDALQYIDEQTHSN